MKKFTLTLVALSVFLSMSACKNNPSSGGESGQNDSEETTETVESTTASITKPTPPKHEGPVRVLFVGNSHTEFFISLPDLVESICKENEKSIEISKLIEMGVDIDEIMDANESKMKTYFSSTDPDGNYFDYVILQEKTPVALMELDDYKSNCKKLVDQVLTNSPQAAIYIYELMSPVEFKDKDEFKEYQDELTNNAAEVAKTLPNAGVLLLGSAISDAYHGKEGYAPVKNGDDLLRFGNNTLHMLNDAGFLSSVIIYRTIFGSEPKIPAMLPLATGTGDNDPIKMQEVKTTISNPEALLKIAAKYN